MYDLKSSNEQLSNSFTSAGLCVLAVMKVANSLQLCRNIHGNNTTQSKWIKCNSSSHITIIENKNKCARATGKTAEALTNPTLHHLDFSVMIEKEDTLT